MDLRMFYRKIREVEGAIASDPVLVVSAATPDGGKAGLISEVARSVAARLIVEGRAKLADTEEAEGFRKRIADAVAKVEQDVNSKRVQVALISEAELRSLRERTRTQKG